MNTIQKRFLLFLLGCIPIRLLFVYLAAHLPNKYLPIMGYIAFIPAIGFLYIYLNHLRKTGPEVFGGKIWWNQLRPVHALLYILFAFNAIYKKKSSWIYLFVDVCIGFFSFLFYHYREKHFDKLFYN